MITSILRVGHTPADTERHRKLKSVFTLVMIGGFVLALDFLLFRERTALETAIDVWIAFAACVGILVLHVTSRHDFAFMVSFAMVLPAAAALLLVTGNGHGDLAVLAVGPVWAVAMLGARRSVPWFIACVSAVIVAAAAPAYLPHIASDIHKSPANEMGWLFHGPKMETIGRNEAITFLGCMLLLYLMMYTAHRALHQANQRIENLLVNVLPPSIAARLTEADEKQLESDGARIADAHDQATILFADIVDFTQLASQMSPADLVALLDRVFARFDDLASRHRVEKIKTIGDAYMAVSGLPDPDSRHAENIADMALAIVDAVQDFRKGTGMPIRIRIGINTGPVVAGIIGRKRFLYDLWGDAVNTASRMESHGAADTIQVGAGTYDALKDSYDFNALGEMEVKGKGRLPVWQLIGVRVA